MTIFYARLKLTFVFHSDSAGENIENILESGAYATPGFLLLLSLIIELWMENFA